jgi:nitrite reductase/ring-hydroxylating ferredoxin subunit/uncharacterized membrane protein
MAVPERHVRHIGETVIETIERQDWLDTIGEQLQKAIAGTFQAGGGVGRRVRDILHGTWFGHPLHPPLTDVPLGAWTTALVLDSAAGSGKAAARAADTAIGIGIVGALGAAVTGLTDWHHTSGADRRVGLGHALLNTAALALYVTSLALRRRGARNLGRGLSTLGFVLAAGAGYIGGTLVYGKRIGVDHSPRPDPWTDFVAVMPENDLQASPCRAEARGIGLVLVRQGDQIHALADRCAHLGGPLSEGSVEDGAIRCPWHGSLFALADGRVLEGPSTFPQACFEVRVRFGQIEARPRE